MNEFNESAWSEKNFASNYLDKADIYIMERRSLFWTVVSNFRHFAPVKDTVRLLDIGCGDGILTELLLKETNTIHATLLDASETMISRAKERLSPFRHTSFVTASFQEILDRKVELGTHDFCVSSMAIHHLSLEEKSSLFKLIAACLSPGGRFVNIDVVLPPSGELESWYFSLWSDWMKDMMDRRGITDETPDELIRRYKDPSTDNRPDTLENQMKAMGKAGFRDVDCYYKNGIFAVFGGKVP